MTSDILELLLWEETVGAALSLSAGNIGQIVGSGSIYTAEVTQRGFGSDCALGPQLHSFEALSCSNNCRKLELVGCKDRAKYKRLRYLISDFTLSGALGE